MLVKKVGCGVQVSKKGYIDRVQRLAKQVRNALQNSKADRCEMAKHNQKIWELSLKVHLSADDFENVAHLQAKVAAWDVELIALCVDAL